MPSATLATEQTLSATLSEQMIQSLALLNLNIGELDSYINEEVQKNPALEISYKNPDNEFLIENETENKESLSEHLLKQFGELSNNETSTEIAKRLISNLDANGFNSLELPELFENSPFTKKQINETVETIRNLDPCGTCVKDFRESLTVQAKTKIGSAKDLKAFTALVNNHLQDMAEGKTEKTAYELKISKEKLNELWILLKTLTPFPGRLYTTEDTNYATPEFSIKNNDGNLEIIMNDSILPNLEISEEFLKINENTKDEETTLYAQSCIKKAEELINMINFRHKTVFALAEALARVQKNFFLNGPMFLKPMKLKDLADELNVHETTISRIANSKYAQTPWGLYRLKDFFSQGLKTTEGETAVSRNVVKEHIKTILQENNKLSDRVISEKLQEMGIVCARRTVSKYRAELDIGKKSKKH